MSVGERGRLLVITGPTAGGKTALGVELALRLGGELVGADSVQVYRGFDIGAAKPGPAELRGVPHHLIDVTSADAPLDASDFARLADAAIADVRARGRLPIVVGGSGLWLRALLRGLVSLPPVDPALRRGLEDEVRRRGLPALYAELQQIDPQAARAVHPHDQVRVLRALEVYRQTGQPLGALREAHALGAPRYDALRVALDPPREILRERIAERVDGMLRAGLVQEVERLVERYGRKARPLGAVGYAQMLEHVCDGVPLEEVRTRIIKATRVYARRQRTWLRNEPGPLWTVGDAQEVLGEAGMARVRLHVTEALAENAC